MKTASSWGNFPYSSQITHECSWRNELTNTVNTIKEQHYTTLPYGNGRSYGDSCLAESGHVLALKSMNRFIAADWNKGTVIVEAGMKLEELLAVSIPLGWFVPVTPGTKYITLGGAVANDVHGKNHHRRGTFGNHVQRFSLRRSDQELAFTCSPTENTELFCATVGGLGLTGIIEWLELQLIPIRSSLIEYQNIRFCSLDEFYGMCTQYDTENEYTVAWIDCLATGKSFGRGVFIRGNHAEQGELTESTRHKISVPFTLPFSVINTVSARLFNTIYYHRHPTSNLNHCSYEPFFYPLDSLLKWNRLYGRKGFQQFQCVIPDAAMRKALPELLKAIAQEGNCSPLAVLKRCGTVASPGLLSFPMPGISLALDFPQHERLQERLFTRIDAIVRNAGGRLYPAKDAHMSGKDFRAFYPSWEQVEKLRDPALSSLFWKRVTT